jgi:hypothetical protein
MKGAYDIAGAIGWHARNLHYVKKLPQLSEYLKHAPTPERKREQGARDVLTLFKRAHAKQKKKGTKDGAR